MANITRRDEGHETQQRGGQRPFWDPFGVFSVLPGWADPFGALSPMAQARRLAPAFEVRETKDAYVFEADLPGMKESEVEISVSGKRLTVSGKRESVHQEQNEKHSYSERAYGSFERTFTVADDAEPERVNAEFRDGVLRIEIAKRAELQPRRVPVRAGDGGEEEETGGAQQRASGGQPSASSGRRRRAAERQRKRRS
jgi:HSP20 family protein